MLSKRWIHPPSPRAKNMGQPSFQAHCSLQNYRVQMPPFAVFKRRPHPITWAEGLRRDVDVMQKHKYASMHGKSVCVCVSLSLSLPLSCPSPLSLAPLSLSLSLLSLSLSLAPLSLVLSFFQFLRLFPLSLSLSSSLFSLSLLLWFP